MWPYKCFQNSMTVKWQTKTVYKCGKKHKLIDKWENQGDKYSIRKCKSKKNLNLFGQKWRPDKTRVHHRQGRSLYWPFTDPQADWQGLFCPVVWSNPRVWTKNNPPKIFKRTNTFQLQQRDLDKKSLEQLFPRLQGRALSPPRWSRLCQGRCQRCKK